MASAISTHRSCHLLEASQRSEEPLDGRLDVPAATSQKTFSDSSDSDEDFSTANKKAHILLDAIYADARAARMRVVIRLDRPGRFLRLSSFSNEELAAIALNRDKSFNEDEQSTAHCEFTERTRIALEPFKDAAMHGDRRGHAMAINYIYSCMTPEVREATQWTPEMISATNDMLDGDIKRLGPIDEDSVLQALLATARSGRSFDLSPLRRRLFTYGPTTATTRHH